MHFKNMWFELISRTNARPIAKDLSLITEQLDVRKTVDAEKTFSNE